MFQAMFKKILQILPHQQVMVVGGAVRDRLLGKDTVDFDLVLEKNPAQWGGILGEKLNGTSFPLDLERGITRVTFPGHFHIDLAQRQGTSWEEDLARRDFTINAMAIPLADWSKPRWKESLLDRSGGVKDLTRRQVRQVRKNIFKEDPLRLLRAFRLAAELDFEIEKSTFGLIAAHKSRLKKAAPERIREEILKLCATPKSHYYFGLMDQSGLIEVFYPEAKKLKTLAPQYYGKGGVLRHSLEGIKYFEDIVRNPGNWFPKNAAKIKEYLYENVGKFPRLAHLKWALLLHDVGKAKTAKVIGGRLRFFNHEHLGARMIENFSNRYRWSNDEAKTFVRLAQHHMRPGNLATHPQVTDKAIHRFFRDLGEDAIAMLLVSLADHLTYLSPKEIKKKNSPHERVTVKMVNRYYNHREKILPSKIINGHDVMQTFKLTPSPLIGEILQSVTEAQAEGIVGTKEEAIDFIRKQLEKAG